MPIGGVLLFLGLTKHFIIVKTAPFFFAALLTLSFFAGGCHPKTVPSGGDAAPQNSPAARNRPYLILISLDGFRWDYVRRFQPPHLEKFIETGVRAESLIPSYPSKTFPNHYTIATGMYPDRHGLVDNSFYDAERDAEYNIWTRERVQDGAWYGGTPIWVQAERSGMVAASFFFVGSEAAIGGVRPSYYYNYDGSVTKAQRVEQAIDWLKLPPAQRPHLITLYFSDMDDAGHRYGPDADRQLREALFSLDEALGRLFEGVEKTGLPVNFIIVSDHGMSPVPVEQLLPVEQLEDEDRYRSVNNGALVHLYLHPGADGEGVYRDLKEKETHYRVYRTAEVPFFEVPPANPRWGDFVAVPDSGYYFADARVMALRKASGQTFIGEHGFDPARREMHGIFYANGPAFRQGLRIPSFKNIHIYPLMCKILGLGIPAGIDGKPEVLDEILTKKKK